MAEKTTDNSNRFPGAPTRTGMGRAVDSLMHAFRTSGLGQWFSPGVPLPPALDAPAAQQAGVAGRKFDFNVGYNFNISPRAGELIGFNTLRALADNFDILRLVIETRKDQVCEYPWQVQYREVNGKRAKPDARTKAAEEMLRTPDGQNEWKVWLRMLLEDLFVLDAPSIYVWPNLRGEVFAFQPVDGSTIKPVIDEQGRRPMEGTAYQQVLKGIIAADYTREELIYLPRNMRTHKVYGYGPVEQIINTVNIALRRQQFTLDYFTSGSVPDALAGVPDSWTVSQVSEFQTYWDLLLATEDGDMSKRRKLRFVPGEIARNFKETKAPPLKDLFDEWLARIVCYCFGIDVTPFVAQVNRSVAETNREQSLMEGLGPSLSWTKSTADRLLTRAGMQDLELMWQEGRIVNPETRMKVLTGYVAAKIMHPDEVRERELGLDKLTEEQKEDLNPTPVDPLGEGPPGAKKPPPKQEGKSLGKASRLGLSQARAQAKFAARIESFLRARVREYAPKLAEALELGKAQQHKPKAADALAQLEWDWSQLVDDAEPFLARVAVAAGAGALAEVKIESRTAQAAMRDNAESWAHDRAAEMIGMKWQHGELVPNPNAKWDITEYTRETIRNLSEQALEEGWSSKKLASELTDAAAFSEERALTVARTEMAKADSQGALYGYKASGVVKGKRWQTAEDDLVSDECVANQEAGTIPLDDNFPSGADAPPNHPNCRCVVLPVLDDED